MLDNQYVQASGFAARGWSKLVLVTNGNRDLQGAIQDFVQAANVAGLADVLKSTHAGLGFALAGLGNPPPN